MVKTPMSSLCKQKNVSKMIVEWLKCLIKHFADGQQTFKFQKYAYCNFISFCTALHCKYFNCNFSQQPNFQCTIAVQRKFSLRWFYCTIIITVLGLCVFEMFIANDYGKEWWILGFFIEKNRFLSLFQGWDGYRGLPRLPLCLTNVSVFAEIPKFTNSLCTITVV